MEYHLRAFKNHFTGSRCLDNLTGMSNDYLLGRAEEELRYITQEFCLRRLIRPSDRYATISGILQAWGNAFKREHVVGIWTDEENWWKDVPWYVTDYGLPGVPALNTTAVSTTSMPPGPASQNAWMGFPGLGYPLAVSLAVRESRTLAEDPGSTSSVPPCLKPPQTGLSSALKVASCFENPRYRRMSGGNPGAIIRRKRVSYA